MNIIAIRQERRKAQIQEISNTIKKAFSAGLNVDKAKLIYTICSEQGVSRRTAIEYLNTALISLNTREENVEGRIVIVEVK